MWNGGEGGLGGIEGDGRWEMGEGSRNRKGKVRMGGWGLNFNGFGD